MWINSLVKILYWAPPTFDENTKYLLNSTTKCLQNSNMEHCSLDQLLQQCKDIRISECLSKLTWKGTKLQRCLFTKMNKDTLCDSLIYIAETLFASTDTREKSQQDDNSTSVSQLQTPNPENDFDEENSILGGEEQMQNSIRDILTQSSVSQEVTQSSANQEDNTRPVCKLFLNNRCPTGIKGQKCTYQHPKQCRKFIQGGRTEHGCENWKCPFLHPKICNNSYLFGSCFKAGCKERHTKNHQTSKNKTEDHNNQPFLWQRQIQEQIDKLATTNLQILQVLSQFQPRTVQVWNQAPPQQTPLPQQPRWRNTNSQWKSLNLSKQTQKRTVYPLQCVIGTVPRVLQIKSAILNLP